MEPYEHLFKAYFTEIAAALKTDGYLLKEDASMHTFWNFILGRDYLNSAWTDQLHQKHRLHVIYLAVRPNMQHHGLADVLMNEVIRYADKHRMIPSDCPFLCLSQSEWLPSMVYPRERVFGDWIAQCLRQRVSQDASSLSLLFSPNTPR